MLQFHENVSLQSYNTFGIPVKARFMAFPGSIEEIHTLLDDRRPQWKRKLILGGGSNVLFTRDFEGLVIHPRIKGMAITGETDTHVLVRAGCGENWDGFVAWCVNQNLGGLENLSHIPGNVGACPVQNLGAYGIEAGESIEDVELLKLSDGEKITLPAGRCNFGYRDSIFKNELKNQSLITYITFRLTRHHVLRTRYPELEKELDNFPETTIQSVREAVIRIRRRKLPDPVKKGNAGSFFKNPVVNREQALLLKKHFPLMPVYDCGNNKTKLSAAWMIEQCNWKGKKTGHVGTFKTQPLVIVNHGGASGSEIAEFAAKIRNSVQNRFGITLETEVNIL